MGQAILNKVDIIGVETLVERDELAASAFKTGNTPDPTHPIVITTIETEFNIVLRKLNTVYKDGWISIPHTTSLNFNKEVTDVTLRINSVSGTKTLEAIINYPSAETYNGQPYQGFLLKDSDGLLSETNDWDLAYLSYNVISSTGIRYDGTKQVIGGGVISDHSSIADTNHSSWTLHSWWDTIYPEFKGARIQSELDSLTGNGSVNPNFTATYAGLKGCDLILRPYTGASSTENPGSNANILTIGAHGGNLYNGETVGARKNNGFVPDTDLSEDYRPEFFFDNLVLVSACKEEGTTLEQAPTEWSSTHGYGCEFYEKQFQQSPTTAVVGAKFRKIQDLTGVNWSIVRLACRKTASLTTMELVAGKKVYTYHWNQYMGFGIIDVDAAIAYIDENYKSQEYRAMLADDLEGSKGLPTFLEYEDLLPNSPVAKRMVEKKLSNIDFLNFPVVNPTTLKLTVASNSIAVACDKTFGIKKGDGTVQYATSLNMVDLPLEDIMLSIPEDATSLTLVGFTGSLDLFEFKELLHLNVQGSFFTEILLYNSTKLIDINIIGNLITTFEAINFKSLVNVNVQDCASLRTLSVYGCALTELLLTGCTSLTKLNCKYNHIATLDLTGLNLLTHVYANNNELTGITLTGLTSLRELYVDYNQLTSLMTPSVVIQYLCASHNLLTTLDFSGFDQLIVTSLNDNLLTWVDLTGCTSLIKADMQNNSLNLAAIEATIAQVTANGLVNINNDYPNRIPFTGNPGAVGLNDDDYTLHTIMGWILTF